jgi:hypothetical protein
VTRHPPGIRSGKGSTLIWERPKKARAPGWENPQSAVNRTYALDHEPTRAHDGTPPSVSGGGETIREADARKCWRSRARAVDSAVRHDSAQAS